MKWISLSHFPNEKIKTRQGTCSVWSWEVVALLLESSFLPSSSLPPSATFCQLQGLPSWNKWLKVNCWLDFPFLKTQEVCVVCNCERTISGHLPCRRGCIEDWFLLGAVVPARGRASCNLGCPETLVFPFWGSCQCVRPGLRADWTIMEFRKRAQEERKGGPSIIIIIVIIGGRV